MLHQPAEKAAIGLRWLARILGVCLVIFFMIMGIGELQIMPMRVSLAESMQLLGLVLTCLGLVVAWRHELTGGLMVLLGMALYFLISHLQSGKLPDRWPLRLAIVLGLFFLLCWGHDQLKSRRLT